MHVPIDLLIEARWIIPVEPADVVLEDHAVAVNDGRIVAILQQGEANTRFFPRQRKRLAHHILIPGLVNLHTHAAMTLLRGLADDLPLMEWLQNHIWPAEENTSLNNSYTTAHSSLVPKCCVAALPVSMTCISTPKL